MDRLESPRRPPFPSPTENHSATRVSQLEDRVQHLEHLLARAVGKLDTMTSRCAAAERAAELARLKAEEIAQSQHDSFGEVLERQTHLERRLEAMISFTESRAKQDAAVRTHQEESDSRLRRMEAGVDAEIASTRQQLSTAVQLLRQFVVRNCDAVSDEAAARFESFENERSQLQTKLAEAATQWTDLQRMVANAHAASSNVDAKLQRVTANVDTLSEEHKTLHRRLASAIRHLSANPTLMSSAAMTPFPKTATNVFAPEPQSGSSESSTGRRMSPPRGSGPSVRGDGKEGGDPLDQFVAELQFLSRNAA